ncbi:MAG TPA: alpha/beta fold hydrolase [Pyrinomonadaceae bacterium]|nr:alpha/beta fold hydrolase [Pyrinomonadaceae bacterium]
MRHFIYAALAVIAGLLFSQMPTAQATGAQPQQPAATTTTQAGAQPPASSGVYTTFVGEQPFGTETYNITTQADGSRRSVADTSFAGARLKVTTTFVQNRPVSFELESGGVRSLVAEFTAQGVRLTAQGQAAREVKANPAALLENGVWHYFIFLLAQYDATRGGAQSFNALLVTQALPFDITVTRLATPSFDVNGQRVATEHYRAATSLGVAFEMWTDAARVPLVVSVPAQRVKTVRQGAEALAAVILPPPAPAAKPSAADPYTSEEVTFQNGEQRLAGTLTIPKGGAGAHPAALLITGSGPQDRDGSVIFDIYRRMAERLSAAGVAVLRVDDRGSGKSSIPTKPTSYRDLVADTRAAFEFLLTRREIDPRRIALIGHSEGAQTALVLGAEDARIAAIGLLAGASRPLDRVLVEQSLYAVALNTTADPADTTKFNQAAQQLIKLFDDVRAAPSAADPSRDNYAWFREHMASDPLALARRVRVPLIVLNGERDTNVLPYHALELAQAAASAGNRQVTLRVFPNLTHIFTPSQIDKSVTDKQATEVSDEFLQTLERWAASVLVRGGK